jgi:long-subunit acyl-CoA synthetase (AMP-forming)
VISVKELIKSAYEKYGSQNFIYTKIDDVYQPITYGEFIEKSDAFAHKLLDDGLAGKNIMIIGKNSVEYMMADLAITTYVGACVNTNPKLNLEAVERIVQKGDIAAILYDKDLTAEIRKVKKNHPGITIYELQDTVHHYLAPSHELFALAEKDPDVCSKIIFTSGTTEAPKGVMLSLRNIFHGWEPLYARTHFGDNGTEVVYVFLPLSHTYCDIYNFLYSFFYGPELYLCSDTDKIGQEILEVRPTAFCAVPIIYRRLYDFYGDNIAQAFGDRIKYLYVGGAIFDKKLRKFYKDHGLQILEAYALTEVASSFAVDYPDVDDLESTGTIYENIDVKIINPDKDGIGDIVVKGDNVFMGYLNDPEKTAAAFTDDGYFITGDYGRVKDHKLYVMGRRKDVLIGENGENVYPEEIQQRLNRIDEVIAKIKGSVGDNGEIFYKVYTAADKDRVESVIAKYNEDALKKDKIVNYEILSSEGISFK